MLLSEKFVRLIFLKVISAFKRKKQMEKNRQEA